MTRHEKFDLERADGGKIPCQSWESAPMPRAILQIAHGMGEHVGRYAPMAAAFASKGYFVVGNDHRGHGHAITAKTPRGDFGAGGFAALVDDMLALHASCRARFPGVPIFLLGHSMGSFATQLLLLTDPNDLSGVILSGSGVLDRIAAEVMRGDQPPDINFNAAFEPARTPFDWLSRDSSAVDAFIADPLCFAVLTETSAASMLASAGALASASSLARIPSSLPLLMISGNQDPVGQQGAGVELLRERYEAAGLRTVTVRLYDGARHELFNELNSSEVIAYVGNWIETRLEA